MGVLYYQTNTEVPAELSSFLDKETFTKARLYALDKYMLISKKTKSYFNCNLEPNLVQFKDGLVSFFQLPLFGFLGIASSGIWLHRVCATDFRFLRLHSWR